LSKTIPLDIALFIAKRIAFNRQPSFSRFIIRLTVAATAVSVAAMIITLSFVNGFQHAVSEKVFSFWGHIRVQVYEPGKSLIAEETPLEKDDSTIAVIQQIQGINRVQAFATRSAVIEKNKEIEGILIKGVEAGYQFESLQPFLKSGRWVNFTDSAYQREIVIAAPAAQLLKVKAGDSLNIHFIDAEQGRSSSRKLLVAGIFKTGIEEYDKLFAIGDIRLIQKLNNWSDKTIGGYEVFLNDYRQLNELNNVLYDRLPPEWVSKTVKEVYPNIFDWLNIQDVNRDVIFSVMSVVALINMISCLLILVLERTRMIGILKATGATDGLVQRIFLYQSGYIAFVGTVAGFVVGAGLALLQQYTGFITLDETAYYVSVAPVKIVWWQVLLVCVSSFLICFQALRLPLLIVRGMKPVNAIQFR
jgi:lipoprotein-releasing system permease protein